MSYYETAEGVKISYNRARQELSSHGVYDMAMIKQFEREVKPDNSGLYKAQEVLEWLGY